MKNTHKWKLTKTSCWIKGSVRKLLDTPNCDHYMHTKLWSPGVPW